MPEEIKREQAEIRSKQAEIRSKIENRMSGDLKHDDTAMPLVGRLGSDTMINAFACNFKSRKRSTMM